MFGRGKKKVELIVPFAGTVVGVEEVPDPVFAQKMLGDGFAVTPESEGTYEVVAPVSGKLTKVFSTGHAFAIVSDQGLEVLVHIGLDTVELKGEGFEILAQTGEQVEAGQAVIRVDGQSVRAAERNLITPVVFTKRDQIADLDVQQGAADTGSVVARATLA